MGTCHNAAASALHEEGEDVPNDKDFGEPIDAYSGEVFGMRGAHQAAQSHVDGSSE